MSQLAGAKVRRGGVTAPHWYGTIFDVSIRTSQELLLRFQMPSKGGGDTDVQVEISPEAFPTILEAMCIVDRQAALLAMSQELGRQIATQPERDKKNRLSVIDTFVQRIQNKFFKTWQAEDKAIVNAVKGVANDLRK